jgi:endonuclease/exonuclease/phosphatase family metal-dependent hydrolase
MIKQLTSLILVLVLLATISGNTASAQTISQQETATVVPGWTGKFDVSTRNMYLGTDFSEIFAAPDTQTLLLEVAEAFAEVEASNVAARIHAIAHEIKTTKPDLIGLQEVALWQTGPFDPTQPSANDVAFDYLQLLLDELNNNDSLHYEAVSVLTNLVAEAPAIGPQGLFDVRFTDRIVLLARTDLTSQSFNVQNIVAQHFSTVLSVPTPTLGMITIPRGYISADVEQNGRTFRFVTAHLESFEEQLGLPFPIFRFAQANELLQGPVATSLPVVMAGDFNADGENPVDPVYQLFRGAGLLDAWEVALPDNGGFTWPLFLQSPFVYTTPNERLDLVLTSAGVVTQNAALVGDRDIAPRLAMPSDHAGVVVGLEMLAP